MTFKGHRVGILAESGRGTRFLYDENCRVAIACALPLEKRDYYWRDGLHPFFQHLGAEGWLRGVLARAGGTADQDDFGLLLNYGADCIGAVGIEQSNGTTPRSVSRIDPIEEVATGGRRSISGVHKKLLAFKDGNRFRPAARPDDPATHIAKFNRDDLPTLVQNEDLSLRLAREVLGEDAVTKAHIGTLEGIETIALLVERFDRNGLERLRLEDFAQILVKPRGQDFGGKYQSSYEEAAKVVLQHSARARIDLDRFFRLVVFNFAIGNADAHLKNFSLLEHPEGLRLSPAYDLLSTVVYNQFDSQTALEIDGKKRPLDTLNRSTLENYASAIGLPTAAATRALDDLAKRFAKAKVLNVLQQTQPHDFRAKYRAVVENQTARIFA